MPKVHDIALPVVTVSEEADNLEAQLKLESLSPEAMVETIVYLQREKAKVEALTPAIEHLRGRLLTFYSGLPPEKRETRNTRVGLATYTEGGERVDLKDRDTLVDSLTQEQLRATYKPDLKALEVILRPDEFARHVKRTPKKPTLTIREQKGVDDYDELDF